MPAVTGPAAAALSREFPAWALWVSGTGRWWASRRGDISAAQRAAGCVPFLHADGPDALAGQLRAQEAITDTTPPTLAAIINDSEDPAPAPATGPPSSDLAQHP